jgi:hypothetical protein
MLNVAQIRTVTLILEENERGKWGRLVWLRIAY